MSDSVLQVVGGEVSGRAGLEAATSLVWRALDLGGAIPGAPGRARLRRGSLLTSLPQSWGSPGVGISAL